jgi:CubicO group peptidase (beta-lactamase class C family)
VLRGERTVVDYGAVGGRLSARPAFILLAAVGAVVEYGDTTSPACLASVHKSVLAVLFGRSVTDGAIVLDANPEELGIDDIGGLLPVERQARVRSLLTARSGVYHASSTATGRRLALGFQDFDPGRQRVLGRADRSVHLAHHLSLSGRDLRRIGRVMLRGGRWGGRQVVPAEWVAESTTQHVGLGAGAPMGYGYLWWLPPALPKGAFLAMGNWGNTCRALRPRPWPCAGGRFRERWSCAGGRFRERWSWPAPTGPHRTPRPTG